MHEESCFLTLTYNDESLPPYGGLVYRDFQLFSKRLREKAGPFRFFVAGEYGEQYARPHFHALIFGLDFHDKRKSNSLYSRSDLYQSVTADKLWGNGHVGIGTVTHASARYTAAYCISKRRPDDPVYQRVDTDTGECVTVPTEFCRMSLKPGIGYTWLQKYWGDIYRTGNFAVMDNGTRCRVPRYFHKMLDTVGDLTGGDVDWLDFQRSLKAGEYDHSRPRLEARELILQSKQSIEKAKHV